MGVSPTLSSPQCGQGKAREQPGEQPGSGLNVVGCCLDAVVIGSATPFPLGTSWGPRRPNVCCAHGTSQQDGVQLRWGAGMTQSEAVGP